MKRLLFAATILAVGAVAARAADLAPESPHAYTKATPPAPVEVYNWTGFYLGAMGGYGWGSRMFDPGALGVPDETIGGSNSLSGGFGGGTIGYNWQAAGSPWVFGVEADAAASGIGASTTLIDAADGLNLTLANKISSFGSVTGRVGYAVVPSVLYYVKGGYAWASNRFSVSGVDALGDQQSISESAFHSGWTIGTGLEWMFAHNWSAKFEYMYADFSSKTYFTDTDGIGLGVHPTISTVKVGVNYHIN
jgi:outer membrane immunogenic protein